jgi:hypothetical protein
MGQEIESQLIVDECRPQDTPGVSQLYRAVYGEEYPIKIYYDPENLAQALARREIFLVVSRTPQDQVVGVGALYHTAPNPDIMETGGGLVLPEYRQAGLFGKMYKYLYEVIAPRYEIPLLHGEPVCNHVYTQKMQEGERFIPMALEVDLMPGETYRKESTAAGRVAALVDCRTYKPCPHRVYIPAAYEEALRFIYSGLDDARELAASSQAMPAQLASEIRLEVYSFAKVARLAARQMGADFAVKLQETEDQAAVQRAMVWQLWLPLTQPWVGEISRLARERGYFLGGVLPRWFGGDALLMQKMAHEPNWQGINLLTERSRRLAQFVREDWRACST